MNGVHCQTSPIITAIRAPHGSLTHVKSCSPSASNTGTNGPFPVSVSIRNMYAMPTGVIVIGRRNTIRNRRRPARRWVTSSASPRPSRYWTPMPANT